MRNGLCFGVWHAILTPGTRRSGFKILGPLRQATLGGPGSDECNCSICLLWRGLLGLTVW